MRPKTHLLTSPSSMASDNPKIIRTCWAHRISACSEKMSGEHVISAGVLSDLDSDNQGIVISSSPNLPSRTIGINSLKVPILCQKHNSELSPLDMTAKDWFQGVTKLVSKPIGETGLEITPLRAVLKVNGWNFERWAAKTFLNLVLSDVAMAKEKLPPFPISSGYLEKHVFEAEKFPGRFGLYGLPLGTNLFDVPELNRKRISLSLITKECRLHHDGRWHGPLRLPAFLYISCHGFENLLYANLTTLNHEDFVQVTESFWKNERIAAAKKFPGMLDFSIDHLDDAMSFSAAPRSAGFDWP